MLVVAQETLKSVIAQYNASQLLTMREVSVQNSTRARLRTAYTRGMTGLPAQPSF